MKNIFFIITLSLICCSSAFSQDRNKQRIKAYKTAYITQELEHDSKEAEKFWPIYNDYEKKVFHLRLEKMRNERKRIQELGGPEALIDEDANNTLFLMISWEKEVVDTREEMYKELSKILPPVKLLKLYHTELNFNKRLLREFRKGPGPSHNK